MNYFQIWNIFYCRDLSYNQITSVAAGAVSSLPYLRILQMDNNNINCIDKKAFKGEKNISTFLRDEQNIWLKARIISAWLASLYLHVNYGGKIADWDLILSNFIWQKQSRLSSCWKRERKHLRDIKAPLIMILVSWLVRSWSLIVQQIQLPWAMGIKLGVFHIVNHLQHWHSNFHNKQWHGLMSKIFSC